jgi:hypothetical protein
MKILEKAKEATDAMVDGAASVRDKGGAVVAGLKESAFSLAGGALEASAAQVDKMVTDLNATLPILKLAGFTLQDVGITLGISPSISASFGVSAVLDDEATEAVAKEHEENLLAVALIRSLARAAKAQRAIVIAGMKPKGLSIQIGLSPSVGIKFS